MSYQIGPCQLLYRSADDSDEVLTDLGKTLGGVTVAIEETTKTLNTDQDGTTPVDEFITGTTAKLTGNLADITLANLAFMLKTTVVDAKKVVVTPNTGYSLMDNGIYIVLKPYVDGTPTTDAKQWITIPKGGIKATPNLEYANENQRVLKFEINGYPDDLNQVIVFGDMS